MTPKFSKSGTGWPRASASEPIIRTNNGDHLFINSCSRCCKSGASLPASKHLRLDLPDAGADGINDGLIGRAVKGTPDKIPAQVVDLTDEGLSLIEENRADRAKRV